MFGPDEELLATIRKRHPEYVWRTFTTDWLDGVVLHASTRPGSDQYGELLQYQHVFSGLDIANGLVVEPLVLHVADEIAGHLEAGL